MDCVLVNVGYAPQRLTAMGRDANATLDLRELITKMQPARVPHKLPVVLSREEMARLLAAAGNLKHQTALSVVYGAGPRVSEVLPRAATE